MPFIKLTNNIITYPYNTYSDYPDTSFPQGSDYPSFNVYWVYPTAQNNPDPTEFNPVEIEPVFNSELGRWEQAWDYVAKSDEEKRLLKYNPAQFLQQMFASSSFESWLSNFSVFKQSGFMNAATNAKVDNNWTVVQGMYNQLKEASAPSQSSIDEWQGYADANGVGLTF